MQSNRSNNLDLLRIVATISVIVIHVNYQFFQFRYQSPQFEVNYVVQSSLNLITRFSVPAFVMLSGYFILNNAANSDIKSFYKKSSYKVLFPTILVIFIYFLFSLLNAFLKHESLLLPIKGILSGNFNNLWYMYMLMGLYLITPFVILVKERVSRRTFTFASIVLMIWAMLSQITSSSTIFYNLGIVFAFLPYYMIGSLFYGENKNVASKNVPIKLAALICLFLITFGIRFMGFDFFLFDFQTNFFSPAIVLFSILTFSLFRSLSISTNLTKLSTLTFYIYLFHTLVYKILFSLSFLNVENELLMILIVSILTFLISLIISMVFVRLLEFIEKKFDLKNKWYSCKIWS